jgi:hypothetical protein
VLAAQAPPFVEKMEGGGRGAIPDKINVMEEI